MFTPEQNSALGSYLSPNEIKILWKVYQRTDLQDYFFRNKSDPKWYFPLKLLGFFSTDSVPAPIESGKGSYSIPGWLVLPYLLSITKQVESMASSDQSKYIAELLEIIDRVSKAQKDSLQKDPQSLRFDNYRTWYFFTQMLVLLPNPSITLDMLNNINFWLISRFNCTLQSSEIVGKLLPKFLQQSYRDDISKAQIILNSLTQISWKPIPAEKRYMREYEKAVLAADAYWLQNSFIANGNAVRLGEQCSDDFIYVIANRLREVLSRGHIHTFTIDRAGDSKEYILQITQPDNNGIHCKLGVVEDEKSKSLFDATKFESSSEFVVSGNDEGRWVDQIVLEVSKQISPQVAAETRPRLIQYMEYFFHDYSEIWCSSLASINSMSNDSAKETLVAILRDLLIGKAKTNPNEIERILFALAGPAYRFPLYKRLVFYVIGKNWGKLSHLFWEINATFETSVFEESIFESEVYQLFFENTANLSSTDRERLLTAFLRVPKKLIDDPEKAEHFMLWQQKWYGALKEDPEFRQLHEDRLKISGKEIKPISREPKVRWGPGPTPLNPETLLTMTNSEIAQFIPEFEKKSPQSWDDPTPEALAVAIRAAVTQSPEKFIGDLRPFLNTGYRYIYEIIFGIREAIQNNAAHPDWHMLSDFLLAYIAPEQFWKDGLPASGSEFHKANHLWVVGMIANTIETSLQRKDRILESVQMKLLELFHICIYRLSAQYDASDLKDPVSLTLNSAAGKIIEAMVVMSLYIVEQNKTSKTIPIWDSRLKADYQYALTKPFVEAHEVLGRHIGKFWVLDKDWLITEINNGSRPQNLWYAFMVGYLHSLVYDELVPIMEPHYKRAICATFTDDRSEDSLIQHIAIIYLRGYQGQSLDNADSLIRFLFENRLSNRIHQLISFVWMQRSNALQNNPKPGAVKIEANPQLPALKSKVMALWKFILNTYNNLELSKSDEAIIGELGKLTVFIDELNDENVGWIMKSVKYADRGIGVSFVIEYLDSLKSIGDLENNSTYLADIFLCMLGFYTPDFQEVHIQSLIEFIFKNGDRTALEKAERICNIYAERGRPEILRALYTQYRSR